MILSACAFWLLILAVLHDWRGEESSEAFDF